MKVKKRNTISYYFGIFILLAMLPQLIGFNGSSIDTVYKLMLLAWLFYKTNNFTKMTKISWFTIAFTIFGIIDTVGIWASNNISLFSEIYILFIGIVLFVILVESSFEEKTIKVAEVVQFYRIYVYFMMFASVYNMIIHFNSLIHITSISVYNAENICSFFDNKNTFGVFLIFAVLASTILRIISREKKWIMFSCIFLLNEMMAMCRTAIVLSIIMIILSFLVDERKRRRNLLIFCGLIFIIFIIINNNIAVRNYIFNNLFGSTKSVEARNAYVESLLPLAKGVHFWFGYGSKGAAELAVQYTGNVYYHNAYLKEIMMGGIIKLGIQIFALAVSVMYGLKCRKIQKNVGNLCLLSTLVYVIYVFAESVILFDAPVVAIMAVMFILSMPILLYNSLKYEKAQRGKDHGV